MHVINVPIKKIDLRNFEKNKIKKIIHSLQHNVNTIINPTIPTIRNDVTYH